MKLKLQQIFESHKITPRGIVYVGAGDGRSLKRFANFEAAKILLIEANPETCERLTITLGDQQNIQIVPMAIATENGSATLHITNIESHSSTLNFTGYKTLYPNLIETHKITIEKRNLDTLLSELNLSPEDFNILFLDIQGAELNALKGASQLLDHIDAIYTTTSEEQLFQKGATLEQVNAFLNEHYFTPVAQASPYHPSRYEVIYIHNNRINPSAIPPEVAETIRTKPEPEPEPTELEKSAAQQEQLRSQLHQTQEELEQSQSQLQQAREELERSQSESQQNKKELEQFQSQLQQAREELERSQSESQQNKKELEQFQSQLQQAREESKKLESSHAQLKQAQEELEELQAQRDQILAELERSHLQLKQNQKELEQSQSEREQLRSQLQQNQKELEQSQSEREQLRS
ncbi:MAG: FkbM family methyltransferase, partial [Limnospira sp.]